MISVKFSNTTMFLHMLTSLLNSSVGEPKTNFRPEVMESGTGKFGGSMFCHLVEKKQKNTTQTAGVLFFVHQRLGKRAFLGENTGKTWRLKQL